MAKSKSSRPTRRVASSNARPLGLPGRFISTGVNLALFEDRRFFHPAGVFAPAFSLPRSAARFNIAKAGKSVGRKVRLRAPSYGIKFAVPDKVVLCVRRKRRKEVIFAKGKAGKRGQRKPKRNYYSSISCKR